MLDKYLLYVQISAHKIWQEKNTAYENYLKEKYCDINLKKKKCGSIQ